MASMRGHNMLVGKLFLIFLVTKLAVVVCQSATENKSSPLESATNDDNSSRGETLLSASEFVDFTETPTLLFDGISSNDNDSISESSPITNTTTELSTTSPANETANQDTETRTLASNEDDEQDEDSKTEAATKAQFEPPQNVSQYMDYIETLFHDLRHQISDLFEPHLPQLIRSSQMVQLSGSCSHDMLRMALALRQFEPWALKMIDSSGKVPEGIFEGSFTALGSYDECLNTVFGQEQQATKHEPEGQTQGKYCLVNVSPFLPPKPPADRVERMFQDEANRRNYTKDDQFSRLSPMFYYMKFRIGVCIPSTCTESDMDSLSEALSSSLRLNITIPNCRIRQSQPITNHQLVGGLVFATVMGLVLGATLMDYSRSKFDRQKRRVVLSLATADQLESRYGESASSGGRFFERLEKNWSWLSFSLFTNYRLHFSSNTTRGQEKEDATSSGTADNSQIIRCLNGIRVISLCWVIVANSYITLDPRATKRLVKTREAPKDFLFQMVAQASLAIETFFFLSGVLMSMSFVRKLQPEATTTDHHSTGKRTNSSSSSSGPGQQENRRKSLRLRWLQFYVHRYVRMTPATMLVIAFTMYAYGYGDGPLWFEATHKAHQSCSQNWWRHLLHVANFIDTRQMCFIHYWYIAADMQLFLFAPVLMYLLYRYRKLGYALVTLIGVASIGSIFYTTYMRNLPPTLLFYNSDPESRREFGNTIMTKPLTHALPYLVGMLVGKWLTASPTTGSSGLNPSSGLTSLFGCLATVVALAEVFLPYKWNNSHLPTRLLASLYAAFFRFAWSLVLAYIIVSCRHRRGRHCVAANVNDQRAPAKGLPSSDRKCTSCRSLANIGGAKPAKTMAQKVAAGNYDGNIIMSSSATHNCNPNLPTAATATDEWCLCGCGGNLVNRLLSLNVFTYLSKLSFVAYLIHLPLMSVFIAQTRGLFAFSHTLVIHLALSYLVMTFLLSFLLVHLIELPFMTFERYLFDSKSRQPSSQTRGASTMIRGTKYDSNAKTNSDTGGYILEKPKTFISGSSSYSIGTTIESTISVSEKL